MFYSQALKDAAIKNKIYLIGGSIPERDNGKVPVLKFTFQFSY